MLQGKTKQQRKLYACLAKWLYNKNTQCPGKTKNLIAQSFLQGQTSD